MSPPATALRWPLTRLSPPAGRSKPSSKTRAAMPRKRPTPPTRSSLRTRSTISSARSAPAPRSPSLKSPRRMASCRSPLPPPTRLSPSTRTAPTKSSSSALASSTPSRVRSSPAWLWSSALRTPLSSLTSVTTMSRASQSTLRPLSRPWVAPSPSMRPTTRRIRTFPPSSVRSPPRLPMSSSCLTTITRTT